ncbi:MAG: tetratricopeptide repeat protein, partial [Ignavibacteriae bacterium]|nr:tetratricopeptide repeat protein [Ignavibacteriota bacterium]
NYNKVTSSDNLLQKNTIYGKAYSYFNLRDFQKAAYFFNEFINKYENDEKYNECELRLADCYYGTKSFEKASFYYERALVKSNKFKNDDRSFFNYAQSLFKQGTSNKAINVLNDFQSRFPASQYSDDSQYLIGWINFQGGKFDEAINSYTKLFSNYPQSVLLPLAHYSIGDSYFNNGDYPKAIESYKRLILQFPNSSYVFDAVNGIQYCYIVQDKQDEAINYLDGFLSKNANAEFADKIQFKKGEIYYSSGNYQLAVAEYGKLVNRYSSSPLIPSSYYWMGKSSIMLNNTNDAISYFEEVIDNSLNTEDGFNSVLELGSIYRKQKNYEREIELYEEILPKISDSKRISELNFVKAQSYIENNNIPNAYQTLNEIVDKRDGSLFYYKAEIELGVLELVRSNYENSIYLFQDVVNNRTDDIAAQAQYYLGSTYFEQEKLPEAITALKKVVNLYSAYDEWYTKSLLLLGDSYTKFNDKANAAEMYKAVLKRHRNDTVAKEAKDKLNQL